MGFTTAWLGGIPHRWGEPPMWMKYSTPDPGVAGWLMATTTLDIPAALRVKREQKKISARKLSSELGKSPAYVSKIESGDIHLTLSGFAEIAAALELSNLEILFLVKLAKETPVAPVS